MATAPLLMLIVAALPRAEAVPVPAELAAPAALVRCALVLQERDSVDHQQRASAPSFAVVPARSAKRPAREPLVQALALAPAAPGLAPALAPRTEPGAARGPPALRV